MSINRSPEDHEVVFVYNERDGEYRTLGSGWDSFEAAIDHADDEGYIDTKQGEFRVGVEVGGC
jgi:hypothetical protein